MKKIQKAPAKMGQAFTLVELIVVITILAILGTIAFISLQGYSKKARDSKRAADISNIKVSLELFSLNTGYYPTPDNGEDVEYDGDLLWTQGIVGTNVTTNLSRNLLKKPTDPLHDIEYIYSLASSKKEYEVMSIYEGDLATNNLLNSTYASDKYSVKVEGNYNELFIKTSRHIFPVPSLVTSASLPLDFDLVPSAIESQVITGGDNLPGLNIPNTETSTGALKMNLSVYIGSINKDSIDDDKKAAVEKIQLAYSGSDVATTGVYKTLLNKTENDELLAFVDTVILDGTTSAAIVDTDCASGEKNGYTYLSLTHTQTGSVSKTSGLGTDVAPYIFDSAIATCSNGTVSINSEISNILYSSCNNILINNSAQGNQNGIYKIDPANNLTGFNVYCDMTTDGGGWTLVGKNDYQSRANANTSAVNGWPLSNYSVLDDSSSTGKFSDSDTNLIGQNKQVRLFAPQTSKYIQFQYTGTYSYLWNMGVNSLTSNFFSNRSGNVDSGTDGWMLRGGAYDGQVVGMGAGDGYCGGSSTNNGPGTQNNINTCNGTNQTRYRFLWFVK